MYVCPCVRADVFVFCFCWWQVSKYEFFCMGMWNGRAPQLRLAAAHNIFICMNMWMLLWRLHLMDTRFSSYVICRAYMHDVPMNIQDWIYMAPNASLMDNLKSVWNRNGLVHVRMYNSTITGTHGSIHINHVQVFAHLFLTAFISRWHMYAPHDLCLIQFSELHMCVNIWV